MTRSRTCRRWVANTGIGAGDYIYILGSNYRCTEQAENLQALQATGAAVTSSCP